MGTFSLPPRVAGRVKECSEVRGNPFNWAEIFRSEAPELLWERFLPTTTLTIIKRSWGSLITPEQAEEEASAPLWGLVPAVDESTLAAVLANWGRALMMEQQVG